MGSTARGTWQARERQAAALFGTKRQYGSGSGGREDETSSDAKHPSLYIEGKLRQTHTVLTLWRDTHKKALKEKKHAVVVLSEKGKPGQFLVIHTPDMLPVAANWLAAQDDETYQAFLATAAQRRVELQAERENDGLKVHTA